MRRSQFAEVVPRGIVDQLEYRERNIAALEENMKETRGAGILIVEDPGKEREIFYVDGWGRCFDAVSGRELEAKGVMKARVEELIEVAKHRVYDKVPIGQCYEDTGTIPLGLGGWTLTKGTNLTPSTGAG